MVLGNISLICSLLELTISSDGKSEKPTPKRNLEISFQCSDKLGLSLELGSFMAGVMVSTTDFAQHTLDQVTFAVDDFNLYQSDLRT